MGAVGADGVVGEVEGGGDFLVGEVCFDEHADFDFEGGERGVVVFYFLDEAGVAD